MLITALCSNVNLLVCPKERRRLYLLQYLLLVQILYVHSLMFYEDLSATINPLQIEDLGRTKHI